MAILATVGVKTYEHLRDVGSGRAHRHIVAQCLTDTTARPAASGMIRYAGVDLGDCAALLFLRWPPT